MRSPGRYPTGTVIDRVTSWPAPGLRAAGVEGVAGERGGPAANGTSAARQVAGCSLSFGALRGLGWLAGEPDRASGEVGMGLFGVLDEGRCGSDGDGRRLGCGGGAASGFGVTVGVALGPPSVPG